MSTAFSHGVLISETVHKSNQIKSAHQIVNRLVFEERGKPEQSREPTNSTHSKSENRTRTTLVGKKGGGGGGSAVTNAPFLLPFLYGNQVSFRLKS